MSYTNKVLMQDEKLIYCTKPHWIIFFPCFVWLLISLLIFIYGSQLGMSDIIFFEHSLTVWLGIFAILIALLHAIISYVTYISAEYAITNKRVIMKVGLIRRNSLEIFLSKIESIHISQGIIGRIFNFGSITISGTGGSKDPFNYIYHPLKFRKLIQTETTADEVIKKDPEINKEDRDPPVFSTTTNKTK